MENIKNVADYIIEGGLKERVFKDSRGQKYRIASVFPIGRNQVDSFAVCIDEREQRHTCRLGSLLKDLEAK